MQRPGFNVQCKDGNNARWGYCANCPSQPCQTKDSDDADAVIGIGLQGQSTTSEMGAGWTELFASGTGTCDNSKTGSKNSSNGFGSALKVIWVNIRPINIYIYQTISNT